MSQSAQRHELHPATGAPVMTQEGMEALRLAAEFIEPVIHLEHSRIWSCKVLAASAQTHILCVHGDLVSWRKKKWVPMKKK